MSVRPGWPKLRPCFHPENMDLPGLRINKGSQIGAVAAVTKYCDFFAVLSEKGGHFSKNRGDIAVHYIIGGMIFGDKGQFIIIDDVLNLLFGNVVGKGHLPVIEVLQIAIVN